MKKRLLSIILTLALCLSLLPTAALAADIEKIRTDGIDANGNIDYGKGAERGDVEFTADTAKNALSGLYYVVKRSMTINGNLTVDGSKKGGLVLCDGVKLTVTGALIHTGGNKFYIYGQTLQNNSEGTGRLVIKNDLDNKGAAIRSESASTPVLGISSGELEIFRGKSEQFVVNNVELYSTKPIHTATLDGTTKSYNQWRYQSSITGNKLVIEYCDHPEANVKYTPSDSTHHIKSCDQCGFNVNALSPKVAACGEDGTAGYVADGANGHYKKCPCGNGFGNLIAHASGYTLTENNTKHVGGCNECGYAKGEAAEHSYDADGECETCKFKPVATDSAGALYDDVNDALEAATNGKTPAKLETKASSKTVDAEITFNQAGESAELQMNGYTLGNSRNATIEVENGTLKITGDATSHAINISNSSGTAIKVTGGKLIFDGKLTATGSNGQPAVHVTGGTLKLKEDDVLNGGVSVEGSTKYTYVKNLLGEGLAFATTDGTIVNGNGKYISESVTVVPHTEHNYTSGTTNGICACGALCPHNNIDDATGKCADCQRTFAALVNNGLLDNVNTAITAWLNDGGTLKLYADGGTVDFTSASAGKTYTIDLNGHKINCIDSGSTSSLNLNGNTLTIQDSREATGNNGSFGTIVADSGTLTMESGRIKGLTIADDSQAKVVLKGGKAENISYSKPLYNLLPDGYAPMNSNLLVDPTTCPSPNITYIIKNTQLTDITTEKKGSTTFSNNTIPFTLSLKTGDTNIGKMSFTWYRIDRTGAAVKLAGFNKEETPDKNDVYTFNVAHATIESDGWKDMTPGEYDVICVVDGKASDAAYKWQTAVTGYKLTVDQADLNSEKTKVMVTNADSLAYTGQALTPEVTVTYNGAALTKDTDYTVSYSDNTNAGTATVTITGTGNYTGTVKKTWTIQPQEVTAVVEIMEGPFTYTGLAIEPTVTVKVGNTVINPNEYTVVYKDNTNVGTATVTIKNNAEGNYKVSGSANFTITKAPSAVTAAPTANTLTYNGGAQALVTAGTANGGTMQYSLTADGEYTAAIPTGKNAGEYTVYYKVVGDSNHDDTAAQSVEVTIGQAPVTVMAKDKSAYVGSEAPALPTAPVKDTDYTVSGLFGTDTLSGTVTLTYDGTPDMTKTGDTAITITGTLANENYIVSYADGKLTVTNKPSSGSSSKPSYSVNTPGKTENGSMSLSTKNAVKGSTVTVTVQPDSGYVLDKLTVTDKDGKALAVTDLGGGKYSFVMPAGTVKVEASFAEQAKAPAFADVSEGDYYYEAVQWAQEKGITDGISENLFGPNQSCTRGQIVTFLWRAAGSPAPKGTSSFADVPAESYYAKAVAWAVENGITNGTGAGTFSPDAPCDRAQSVTFLFRALGGETEGSANFSDVPAESYYADAVAWAAENGITNGTSSTTFSPNDTCTRGQIVTFLYRGYQGK